MSTGTARDLHLVRHVQSAGPMLMTFVGIAALVLAILSIILLFLLFRRAARSI